MAYPSFIRVHLLQCGNQKGHLKQESDNINQKSLPGSRIWVTKCPTHDVIYVQKSSSSSPAPAPILIAKLVSIYTSNSDAGPQSVAI